MFHWIVMNVIYMPSKILFIHNRVFPKPPLPNRCFSPFLSGFISLFT